MWTEYMWLGTEFSFGACEEYCTLGLHKKREIYGQLTDHWLLKNVLTHVFTVKSNDMHTALENSYMFQPLFLNYFSQNINGTSSTNILPHCSNTLLHKVCLLYSMSNESIKILIGWSFVFTVFIARIVKSYRIVQRQSFLNVTHRAVQLGYWNC